MCELDETFEGRAIKELKRIGLSDQKVTFNLDMFE